MTAAAAPLALIAALLVGVDPPRPEEPTVESLARIYRANFDSFKVLDVRWKTERECNEAWFTMAAQALQDLANVEATAAEPVDPTVGINAPRVALDSGFAARRTAIQNEIQINRLPQVTLHGLLTDHNRFLIRSSSPSLSIGPEAANLKVPESPLTAENLNTTHRGYSFLSFAGDPAKGYRYWYMYANNPTGYGQILLTMSPIEGFALPPLSLTVKENLTLSRHLTDRIFDTEENRDPAETQSFTMNRGVVTSVTPIARTRGKSRIVGRKTIDGHETVILERVDTINDHGPSDFISASDWKKHLNSVVREETRLAYIDPARGALPLRVEWRSVLIVGGKRVPRELGNAPERVFETREIVSVPGGGFYPTKTIDRTYRPDPRRRIARVPIADLLAGKGEPIDAVVTVQTTFQTLKVEAPQTLSDADIALPFPKGHYYYNQITGESIKSGEEDRDESLLPWSMTLVILSLWAAYGVVALARRRRTGPAPA